MFGTFIFSFEKIINLRRYYYTIDKFEKKIVRSEREQEKKKDADRYKKVARND